MWPRMAMNVAQHKTINMLKTSLSFLKRIFKNIYLFLDKGEGREKERQRNINVWLPLAHPLPGTQPTTQAWALTRNWTSNPLVHRLALNPLSPIARAKYYLVLLLSVILFNYWDIYIFYISNHKLGTCSLILKDYQKGHCIIRVIKWGLFAYLGWQTSRKQCTDLFFALQFSFVCGFNVWPKDTKRLDTPGSLCCPTESKIILYANCNYKINFLKSYNK